MKDFKEKVAFVTGGASGIGFGIAKALAGEGARVAIGDIRLDHLEKAVSEAADAGLALTPYELDVTDRERHVEVAGQVERELGPVHILALNAGLGVLGQIKDATYDDWDWVMGVNLGGVINGLRSFLPAMREHGQGGHIMATSSMGGLVVADNGGIYSAAKAAVISMMRCLRADLAKENFGVSVLCPAAVNTNIHEHYDMRPDAFAAGRHAISAEKREQLKQMLNFGMSPDEVGRLVLEAIRNNDEFIFTTGALAPMVEMRRDALLASLPDDPIDEQRWQADEMVRKFMDASLA